MRCFEKFPEKAKQNATAYKIFNEEKLVKQTADMPTIEWEKLVYKVAAAMSNSKKRNDKTQPQVETTQDNDSESD